MPPLPPAHEDRLDSYFLPSVFGYAGICLTALFFSCLTFVHPIGAAALTREDGWVENLTAISLFLAGVLLFATARMERNTVRRCVYVLGGLMMVFGAGEEISWGQRIFGFDTNVQRETNIHNMPKIGHMFFQSFRIAPFLLCTVALAAFFCRKDEMFGIPLPSIFLVLCFLMVMINKTYPDSHNINPVTYYARFILDRNNALLLVLLFFTLFCRQSTFFIATSSILAFSCARRYAFSHTDAYTAHALNILETQEFLFGLSCFFYATGLFGRSSDHEGRATSPWNAIPFGRKFGERIAFANPLSVNVRLSMSKGICTSIIAGSIGLAALGYFSPGLATAFVEKGYSRIKAAKPIIRSEFDVYLIDNQLIYFKTPCAPSDKRQWFFLHVIPADTNTLPGERRRFGFDNFDRYISVRRDATHAGGRCLSIVPLPDYDIVSITTGQFTGKTQSWNETFRFIEPPG